MYRLGRQIAALNINPKTILSGAAQIWLPHEKEPTTNPKIVKDTIEIISKVIGILNVSSLVSSS
jgi:hypothetical protein